MAFVLYQTALPKHFRINFLGNKRREREVRDRVLQYLIVSYLFTFKLLLGKTANRCFLPVDDMFNTFTVPKCHQKDAVAISVSSAITIGVLCVHKD